MKQLVRNYKPDPLQELIRMGRDAHNDFATAIWRQTRFLTELEEWRFFEQPGFENLPSEIEELRRIRKHYDNLMEQIVKRLRELNDAMIEAEKQVLEPSSTADEGLAASLLAIDEMFASINGDASNNNDNKQI